MIDVIIPTKGENLNNLVNCLQSISQQTLPVNIIVAAKKITSELSSLLIQYNAKLIQEPKTSIPGSHRASACNEALRYCTNEYVAFADDDIIAPKDWLENSIRYLTSNVAGVTTGCVEIDSAYHKVQTLGSASHAVQFYALTEVESIPGYNAVYRRKAIIDVGGFDEAIGGCEDWELNYRLRKAGLKLYGVPFSPVIHRHNYTWRSFAKQMFGYGWSRARLLKKKHIFTLTHALPSLALIFFLASSTIDIMMLPSVLLCYVSLLFLLPICIGVSWLTPKFYLKTIFAYALMLSTWSLGYLKGLIK